MPSRKSTSAAAPRRAATPRASTARSARTPAVKNYSTAYEAGGQSRRTFGWRAPELSGTQAVLGNLETIRNRSRAAARNDGYAFGVIDHLVANIIGTGMKPLSQIPDTVLIEYPTGSGTMMPLRQAIHLLWNYWTDEADADGLLDFYGMEALAVRGWLEGGETFIRQRLRFASDGYSVPLQFQIIEPELCPHTYNAIAPSGNKIRAGIEFNVIGQRVAYYFYPWRPGDLQEIDRSQLYRVPAASVSHLFEPLRAGQLRGLPHLTRILIRLFGMDKMDDATLVRQQLSNMFVGFITRPSTTNDAQDYNVLTGEPKTTDARGEVNMDLKPGLFQELDPGEEVSWSDPPDVSPAYGDFMRQQLYHTSAATGVPYELLTGDLSRVNDRTVRVILNEFRRRVMMFQHQIVAARFCRPAFNAWMDRAYLSGALQLPRDYETNQDKYNCVRWIPQGWPYINPVQDIQAQKDAIRSGLDSRSSLVSEQGEDAEAIDQQQAMDNTRADTLRLRYDSDGRQAATPKLSSDPNTEPDPTPATDPAKN